MLTEARDLDLSNVEALVLDIDGTLVNAGTPTPGAVELVAYARQKAIPHVFCTQDPEAGEARVAAKLQAAGFDVHADEIVTAAATIVAECGRLYPGEPIEMICMPSQIAHLTGRGLRAAEPGETAPATLFGLYGGFSAADLERGCAAAWRGADLWCVGLDRSFRMPQGLVICGGSFPIAVAHVTGKLAEPLGKPSRAIAGMALARLGVASAKTLVFGDTLDSDVKMGRRIGARTIAPLTGTTRLEDALAARDEERPDHVIRDASVLLEALRAQFG